MEQCAIMDERGADRGLIEACQRGEREAFRRLFETYKDKVYAIALHFLHGDEASAEDITGEVFLRLFHRIGQYRSEAEFATWLYRLVTNACIDEQRRRRRWVPFGDDVERGDSLPGPAVEELYARAELADCVKAALAELSPELRMTVLLKYFEELSYDEMARALGCSKGTVASRLHRGLKLLGQKLQHLRPVTEPGE